MLIKIIMISQIIFYSCGIYSLSGSLPAHIKTMAIPLFENQTAEFGLSEDITERITEKFNESGVLKLVDLSTDPSSILRGTINKIKDEPFTYNKQESVSEYRYTIYVKIEWYDVVNDKNILQNTYSGFGAYGISGDIASDGIDNDRDGKIDDDDDDEFGEPRTFATKVAISKISEDILNDIMTTW